MTVRAGVVGNPIAHSLSPAIHGAWIAAARLDASYEAFEAPLDGFTAFVRGLRDAGVRGVNVTIPFKEEALALADRASDLAKLAGAANLLVFEADGSIFADNTDGPGLLGALKAQAGYDPKSGPAVILGAGGAARGAAAALALAGAPSVRIVNRTRERAEALAASIGSPVEACGPEGLKGAAVVINATSLGLGGGAGPDADLSLAPGAVVMDMVYKPLRTQFLERAVGHATVDGLEMLIRQAAPAFEALFGRPPPDADVRAIALARLAP